MVRSVSVTDRPQGPKTAELAAKPQAPATSAVPQRINDSFRTVPPAPLLEARVASFNVATQPRKASGAELKDVVAKLESVARAFTAAVKSRPMADEVMARLPPTTLVVQQPALAGRLVQAQHEALSGELAATPMQLELLKGLTQALSQQVDRAAGQKAKLSGEAAAQLQVFIDKARATLTQKTQTDDKNKKQVGRMSAGDAMRPEPGEALSQPETEPLTKAFKPFVDLVGAIDVETMAQLVMIKCAGEQEQDLKDVLAHMKSMAEEKRKLRTAMNEAKAAREKVSAAIRDEYNVRTSLDAKNTFYVDPAEVPFEQYEKDRELAGNVDAVLSDPLGTTAMLALTNNLKIYPKKDTGPVPSPDELDRSKTVAIDQAKMKYDEDVAAYKARMHEAAVKDKAEKDAQNVRDVDAYNAGLAENEKSARESAESLEKNVIPGLETNLANIQRDKEAAAKTAKEWSDKADELERARATFPNIPALAGVREMLRVAAEDARTKGGPYAFTALILAGAEIGAQVKLNQARGSANAYREAEAKWKNEPRHVYEPFVIPEGFNPGPPHFTETEPKDPRQTMVTGDKAIDDSLAAAAANPTPDTLRPLYAAINEKYPGKAGFAAYTNWLASTMRNPGVPGRVQFPDAQITALQTALGAFYTEAKVEEQATIDGTTKQSLEKYPAASLKITTAASFDVAVDKMKARMDTLGDLTSEMQIKVQLALDRRSKLYETLSAIMKKASQTASSIIENTK